MTSVGIGLGTAILGGAETGAEVGGAGGTVVPGAGTLIGGIAGAIVGAGLGLGGYLLYEHLSRAHDDAQTKLKEGAKEQACATCEPENPCEHLRKGNGDGKYRGGGHGDPNQDTGTSSPRGDELDSHHMPAKQAYKGLGLDPADGPAIQMEPEDHQDTADYGGRGQAARAKQAQQIKDGDFDQAFDESADNVRDIARSKGDPTRYDQAIKEAQAYKDCLKEHGLLPGQGEDQ